MRHGDRRTMVHDEAAAPLDNARAAKRMAHRRRPAARRCKLGMEALESRALLAGDLVAHWSADQVGEGTRDGETMPFWVDRVAGIRATAEGTPQWVKSAVGTRPAVRLNPVDGADYFTVSETASPLSNAGDFTLIVGFATNSTNLSGQNTDWFANTGLVDANRLAFAADWGTSINAAGQVAGGTGGTTAFSSKTVYSTEKGLNDGKLHVVSFSRQGSTLSLSVDGGTPAVQTQASTAPRATLPMVLGALSGGTRPFPGDLADIRVYNGALTAEELATVVKSIVAPVAIPDYFFVEPGARLVVAADKGVAVNDQSTTTGAYQITLVQPPARGQLTLNLDGSLEYQPSAAFTQGVDTFTYTYANAQGVSQPVKASLVINGPDDQKVVRINELHVNPDVATEAVEFIELHNPSSLPIDASGWFLADAVQFRIPDGSQIPPRGFLVISQNPAAVETKYGVRTLGPWTGQLSNQGETVELRNALGDLIDRVDYQIGFPWPTVGDVPGYSMELIDTSLDNDLGGNWRSSIGNNQLIRDNSVWQYFKGRSEPSDPRSAWRGLGYDASSWSSGPMPIGFGSRSIIARTNLEDMRNGYTTVYLRKEFEVDEPGRVTGLTLQALYDDGFVAWINGKKVALANVPAEEMAFDAVASGSLSNRTFENFVLDDPATYLVAGKNVLTIQLLNQAIANADLYFDARLVSSAGQPAGPTPGDVNSVQSLRAAPAVRQVKHVPEQPKESEPVAITALVTDPQGVAKVTLQYQEVKPGSYIRIEDPAYYAQWTNLPMRDDGAQGDAKANDGLYTAIVPPSVQVHRSLVRYRITAADTGGQSVTVPYADDPQPNFAYFTYNGVPEWKAAEQPGTSPTVTFSKEVMNQLPVYQLLANKTDVTNSQYNGAFEEVTFHGTMVYDGQVYDHIEFGVRGEFSTYYTGKNKWKFRFNRGHDFQAKDDYGNAYEEGWRIMNFSNVATPWVLMNRGMGGMDEAIAFRLYNLAGLASPNTNYLQFRVIDDAAEAPTNQYDGDLWGLYMTLEHPDGQFLDEHDLPDGSTYKVENAGGDMKHQGATEPNAAKDFTTFMNTANRTTTPEAWWRANVDMGAYYTFRAINRAVNNMDIRDGWNHYLYHNSETNKWVTVPWDLDMLYVPTTHWSGEIRLMNSLRVPALAIEYRNRCRELQDLLFTPEQIGLLVDEYANLVNPKTGGMTMVDVDQYMWNYNPKSANGHRGAFNQLKADYNLFQGPDGVRTLASADHEGYAQWIKDFMLPAPGGGSQPAGYGARMLAQHAIDAEIPNQPVVSYLGAAGFPIDQLRFATSAFSDPQGDNTFGALQWRLAEVTNPAAPAYDPKAPPRYEIETTWTSDELTNFASDITIPQDAVKPGHAYRVRVRMKDATGRWSRWSEPSELIATPGTPTEVQAGLRVSELHYHPADPTKAEIAAGFTDADQFEFLEFTNISGQTIDLRGVSLLQTDAGGVAFDFASGPITQLAPNARVVVVADPAAFAFRYGSNLPVAGAWDGQLSNGGETITVEAAGVIVQQFTYDDGWYPTTDGGGPSLEVVRPSNPNLASWSVAAQWAASRVQGGSPGRGPTVPGDSNDDGLFNSADLVLVFQAGKYEDNVPQNASFAEGDWNGDGDFTTADLVFAFQAGTYTGNSLPAAQDAAHDADWLEALALDVTKKKRGDA